MLTFFLRFLSTSLKEEAEYNKIDQCRKKCLTLNIQNCPLNASVIYINIFNIFSPICLK